MDEGINISRSTCFASPWSVVPYKVRGSRLSTCHPSYSVIDLNGRVVRADKC
jgi:hypothetical protein